MRGLHEKINECIDAALNNALTDCYQKTGIMTGDITPLQQQQWDGIVEQATELFENLILLNCNNKEPNNSEIDVNVRTLFVLDYDGTCAKTPDGIGIAPTVYLIPASRQKDVEQLAQYAREAFVNGAEELTLISDYFEIFMQEENVKYQRVGDLEIPFGERQIDYLADYIPRVVV